MGTETSLLPSVYKVQSPSQKALNVFCQIPGTAEPCKTDGLLTRAIIHHGEAAPWCISDLLLRTRLVLSVTKTYWVHSLTQS